MNGKSSDSIKCLKQRFIRILNILALAFFVILDITCVYCIFVLRTYLHFHDEVENKPSLSKVIIGNQYILQFAGISLSLRPANGKHRYIVTTSCIGWAND